LASCEQSQELTPYIVIYGREVEDGKRLPLYRARMPRGWHILPQKSAEGVQDTTVPIAEFAIEESLEAIQITVHNFFVEKREMRIPKEAQISRWQKQFSSIEHETMQISPQAFSGFTGLLLDCCGMQKGKEVRILAWILQLADVHWQTLDLSDAPLDEKKADVAIKVVGTEEAIAKHEKEIFSFVRSFECQAAFPMPL
jgi:hypothetical protein